MILEEKINKWFEPKKPRPAQITAIKEIIKAIDSGKTNIILDSKVGTGKQIEHSTPVLTSNGWTTHGELKVGDTVYGLDGKEKKIEAISEESKCNMKITFRRQKGKSFYEESFYTHENHIWILQKESTNSLIREYSTKELFNTKLINNQGILKYKLPLRECINYKKEDLPIDPYWLGLWLGDGTKNKPIITQTPSDIKEWINTVPYSYTAEYTKGSGTANAYDFRKQGIIQAIRKLNLYENKHIPNIYKKASKKQRLELLAGLIDSDGCIKDGTRYAFDNGNKKIVIDVREVLLSLGFVVSQIKRQKNRPRDINNDGNISFFKDTYKIVFNPNIILPCRLERHKLKKNIEQLRMALYNVEYIDTEKMGKCIQVEEGNYLIGRELIPTHNSFIGMFIADYYNKLDKNNDSYIFVPTKYLQNQLEEDFPKVPMIKGRSNFECCADKQLKSASEFVDFIDTCANAKCQRSDNEKCEHSYSYKVLTGDPTCPYKYIVDKNTRCDYIRQKHIGSNAPITILNYDYGMFEFGFAQQLEDRYISVMDELHNIEPKIIGFCKVEINSEDASYIKRHDVTIDHIKYILELRGRTKEAIESYDFGNADKNTLKAIEVKETMSLIIDNDILEFKEKSMNDSEREKRIFALERKKEGITQKMNMILEDPLEWVWYFENNEFIFAPITVMNYASILMDKSQINILMSGTPFNQELITKWLNLNQEETTFIKIPDSFPPENHQIHLTQTGRFSGNGQKTPQSKMYKDIETIMKIHHDQKGIIHCPSAKLAYDIKENIKSPRLKIYKQGNTINKEHAIRTFKQSKNDILIGFSLDEGVDFKDDEARFQIITKNQNIYPTKEIQARNTQDQFQWYYCQSVKSLQQTLGRIIRSKNDWGTTYILDTAIDTVLKQAFKHNIDIDYILHSLIHPNTKYQLTNKPNNKIRDQSKKDIIKYIKNNKNTVQHITDDIFQEEENIKSRTLTSLNVNKILKELEKSEHIKKVKT